jgi:hypothetical protein
LHHARARQSSATGLDGYLGDVDPAHVRSGTLKERQPVASPAGHVEDVLSAQVTQAAGHQPRVPRGSACRIVLIDEVLSVVEGLDVGE